MRALIVVFLVLLFARAEASRCKCEPFSADLVLEILKTPKKCNHWDLSFNITKSVEYVVDHIQSLPRTKFHDQTPLRVNTSFTWRNGCSLQDSAEDVMRNLDRMLAKSQQRDVGYVVLLGPMQQDCCDTTIDWISMLPRDVSMNASLFQISFVCPGIPFSVFINSRYDSERGTGEPGHSAGSVAMFPGTVALTVLTLVKQRGWRRLLVLHGEGAWITAVTFTSMAAAPFYKSMPNEIVAVLPLAHHSVNGMANLLRNATDQGSNIDGVLYFVIATHCLFSYVLLIYLAHLRKPTEH